jgi:two-component system sensor histidine kinase DegS
LCSLSVDVDTDKAKLALSEIGENLRSVIDEMRSIIFDLRPIDFGENGMREDLMRLLYKMNEQNRFFISTDIDDLTFHNHITQVSIYRIVKECINNALRHSKGNQIIFTLKQKESVCEIMIKDNGIGFETDNIQEKRHNHFGLSMIEERVSLLHGTWKIESNDQTGTTISITLPWSD